MQKASTFGSFFRQTRKALGISLREFCRRNGYDAGNISRLERDLVPPPHDSKLLGEYAKALKLEEGSAERARFMYLASAETGRIPDSIREDPAARLELSKIFRRPSGSWSDRISSVDLENWADYLDARSTLPQLVRRLVHATADKLERTEFPAGDASQRRGWDGIVESPQGYGFVPSGISGWEMGVDSNPQSKAEQDFRKRSKNTLGIDPKEATFVFVTPRRWDNKDTWCNEKKQLGIWNDVRAYDSSSLAEWLEIAPGTATWFERILGGSPEGVRDLEDHWNALSSLSEPSMKPNVFLTSREKQIKALNEWLQGSAAALAFEARSPMDVVDFLTAYLASLSQPERDAIEARAIIVETKDAWKKLSDSRNHLILIAQPGLSLEPELSNDAVRKGHKSFLCSHRFANEQAAKIELPRVHRYELEEALLSSGFDREKATRLARESGGSLTVLKRRIGRFPDTNLPAWAHQPAVGELVPILLAGGWDDASDADRAAMAKLARRPYEELLSVANNWLSSEDPPLIRIASRWSLLSREDSWALIAPYVTRQHLDDFERVILDVLGEEDPRYELPTDKRWHASMYDKTPKHSEQLRKGLAETIALLGARGKFVVIEDPTGPALRADRVIRKLLPAGLHWKRWASLSDHLRLLAEASPEVFLDAVDRDIRSQDPQLIELFTEQGDPFFSKSLHVELLWAMETLAWEPTQLTTVGLLLARLANPKTESAQSSTPLNCLAGILSPWFPQTCANVDQRIRVIRKICQDVPDAGWQLLLKLAPQGHGFAVHKPKPTWRDWAVNWKEEVTHGEFWKQVEAIATLLLEKVGEEAERWTEVIELFENLPSAAQDELIKRMSDLDAGIMSTEARKLITDKIRHVVRHHRSFPDAEWVMPEEKLRALENLEAQFSPTDPVAKHAWLFVGYPQIVETERTTWQERDKRVFELRRDALKEILAAEGFDGLLRLVKNAEDPFATGYALGKTGLLASDDEILPALLVNEDEETRRFAEGYTGGTYDENGREWMRNLPLDKWSDAEAANFLAAIPPDRELWNRVSSLGPDVNAIYWKRVGGYIYKASTDEVEYAVNMLLEQRRPFVAAEVIGHALYDRTVADASLIMRCLEDGMQVLQAGDTASGPGLQRHTLQELFKRLQSLENVDIERLATLEWQYLGLLDGHGAEPVTLHRTLKANPKFFGELLTAIYKPRSQSKETTGDSDEETKARVQSAYRLLRSWNTSKDIPGTRDDGTIDGEQLREWVLETRRICTDLDRLEVCDLKIGELLAQEERGEPDGSWPCIPVRDIIDEIGSDEIVRGFEVGMFNKRGVFSRSLTEGGEQERDLASQYESHAKACDIEWPRTAASLRHMAQRYNEMAKREDEEVLDRY